MARRKIREYDAKKLLAEHLKERGIELKVRAVQVSEGTDLKKLAKEHHWLMEEKLVAKPDMLFGKRGKNNLVLLNANLHEVEKFLKEKLGRSADISGVKGVLTHFIVEPFVPHEKEYYFSIASGRDGDSLRFSAAGGMEVEENWDKIAHVDVPAGASIEDVDLRKLVSGQVPENAKDKAVAFIKACYGVFADLNYNLLEMNPFTFDVDGTPIPLDMRTELDDTAAFKNMKKWNGTSFPQPFGRKPYPEEKQVSEMDKKTGASLKLTILNPHGRIWTMVAGGGASVIYADTVADMGYGSELGNYGEYSGNPNEEETYQYASILLDLATRNPDRNTRALLIGGGIANFTDVAKTFKGIIRALKDHREKLKKANVRIYVRRGGPNYQAGLKMMRELGKELGVPIEVFGPETSMTHIVPMAIDYVKEGE